MIAEGVSKGAKIIILPAFFNAPYSLENIPEVAEEIEPFETRNSPFDFQKEETPTCSSFLSTLAKLHKIHIIGGAIIEREGEKYFQTCPCFDDKGQLKLKYRKLHIISPQEEKIVTPGSQFGMFKTPFARFGIGISEDIRFIEYPLILSERLGANFLCFPSHYSSQTGSLHLQSLARSRAIDAQCFVATPSTAPAQHSKQPYGHSLIIDPWGKILKDAGQEEGIIVCQVDLKKVQEVKESLRYATQKRPDVYRIKTQTLD